MNITNKILIIVMALFIISCSNKNAKKYVLSPQETLNAYINNEDILSTNKIANIILCKKDTELFQFIDLRTPHEFAINHYPGAINIPSKDIIDKKYLNILNQDKKINILYGSDTYQSLDAFLMLKQLNYKNNKLSLGGYKYIKDYILDAYGIKTGIYDDEKPKYDFIRLVVGTEGPKYDSISKPSIKGINMNVTRKDFDEECPDLN